MNTLRLCISIIPVGTCLGCANARRYAPSRLISKARAIQIERYDFNFKFRPTVKRMLTVIHSGQLDGFNHKSCACKARCTFVCMWIRIAQAWCIMYVCINILIYRSIVRESCETNQILFK